MRIFYLLIFFILLIFYSSVLAADWEYFETNKKNNKLYYDKESIIYPYKKEILWGVTNVKDKNRPQIWILVKYSDAGRRKLEREKKQYYYEQATKSYDEYLYLKSMRLVSVPSPREQDLLREATEYKSKADTYVAPENKTYNIIINCEQRLINYENIAPNSAVESLLKKVCD